MLTDTDACGTRKIAKFKSMSLATLIFAALAICFVGPAHCAQLSSYSTADGKIVIKLSGEIFSGDGDDLRKLIKTANDKGKSVSGLRLSSPGGNLLAGADLADIVRYAHIATVVPNGATCASACFLIFAAGSEKFVSRSARVGVHGASDESGEQTANASAATIGMARMSKQLGVPDAIIGKMVITPPSDMVWLSEDDLGSMHTTLTGKPSQVAGHTNGGSGVPGVEEPQQVQPQTRASVTPIAAPTWSDLVESAVAASASQNGGQANHTRTCQPELGLCNDAIFLNGKDGSSMMIRRTTDADGKELSKDICTFNSFGDIRTCVNWDSGVSTKEMKDAKGEWYPIH